MHVVHIWLFVSIGMLCCVPPISAIEIAISGFTNTIGNAVFY